RAVKLRIVEGESLIGVDVVNDGLGNLRIVLHLSAIEADADHARGTYVFVQVRAPTAHQVEDGAALWKQLGIDLTDLGDGAVIYMDYEARHRVEKFIFGIVDAAKELRFKIRRDFTRA